MSKIKFLSFDPTLPTNRSPYERSLDLDDNDKLPKRFAQKMLHQTFPMDTLKSIRIARLVSVLALIGVMVILSIEYYDKAVWQLLAVIIGPTILTLWNMYRLYRVGDHIHQRELITNYVACSGHPVSERDVHVVSKDEMYHMWRMSYPYRILVPLDAQYRWFGIYEPTVRGIFVNVGYYDNWNFCVEYDRRRVGVLNEYN